MSDYFGPEVGRHLSSEDRQFSDVLYLPQGPIIAEEFILGSSIQEETRRQILQNNTPSGFITNPSDPKEDFQFDRKNSNQFWFGKDGTQKGDIPYALVNGWIVPVAGTNNSNDLRNVIQLTPPQNSPSSSDVNFVFLEVWEARISPDNDVNKPSNNEIYKFGNVEYGGSNLSEEMLDPRFEKESSERTQIQYRIRVINGVDPTGNPYGFNSSIKAQGPLDSPLSTSDPAYQYENMEEELNDPGMWRAGEEHNLSSDKQEILSESDLETVDGFVYAVPLCFVFRRTSQNWTVTTQMGAHDRNPNMTQADEAEMLPTVNLNGNLARGETTDFEVDTSQSSTKFPSGVGLMRIDDEIIEYSQYAGTTVEINRRGAKDTHQAAHSDGAQVDHVSDHPKGYFSDQIVENDVYDLRNATSFGDWDYDSLLEESFQKLIKGDLKTQWKISKGDLKGLEHFEVDFLGQNPQNSSYVEDRDRPDGFRKVFSDACTPQPNNLLVASEDESVGDAQFELNPDNVEVSKVSSGSATDWTEGDTIRVPLDQFRNSFDDVARSEKVRAIHPNEYIDTPYDTFELWFGSTYENNGTSGLESTLNSRGSDPSFLVFGKKPDDLGSSFLSNSGDTISYDDTASPSTINPQGADFSQQPSSIGGSTKVGDYLANQDAWIVIRENSGSGGAARNGAFKILGSDGSQGLEVEDTDGSDPSFGQTAPTGLDWFIRQEECTELDDEFIVALASGITGDTFDTTNLFLSYDLLYHPSRGLTRCPKEMPEIRLESADNSYLREETFENNRSTTSDIRKFDPAPMDAFPHDRTGNPSEDPRDVQNSVEEVWSEAYVDRGSKTLLLQPVRKITATAHSQDQSVSLSYGSLANTVGFEGDNTTDPIINVPGNLLPNQGRIDVPFVDTETTSDDPPWGINTSILQDSNNGDNQNFVISNYLSIYDPVNLTSSNYNSVVNLSNVGSGGPGVDALTTRYYDEGGVEGIELSQHFGFSRIYGVYERDDFYNENISGRGEFASGTNDLYRQKDPNFDGSNLLRTDGERRSVFITDDNSFVIPRDVIDESSLSEDFEDTSFIIEAALFAFRDWSGQFVQFHPVTNTISSDVTFNLEFLTNAPPDSGAEVTAISTRIPYQGNVAGTMPASTTNTANTSYGDYRSKNEPENTSNLNQLNQDLDIDDARVENPVRGEVLSMMPFATSLGTGRVSGEVKHGSYTDVGYLNKNGYPQSSSVGTNRKAESRGLTHVSGVTDQEHTVSDRITGLTERLPMGLYGSDHQFIGEGFYGDQKKFWKDVSVSYDGHGSYKDDQALKGGPPEDSLIISDATSGGTSGSITYGNGSDLYRTYRGGTAMSEDGGPILMTGDRVYKEYPFLRDFITEYTEALENNSFNPSNVDKEFIINKHERRLQIHGSVMFGVAFLIRTRKEEVTDSDITVNHGDELQMAVMTGSVFGQDIQLDLLSGEQAGEFLDPFVQLHPAGSGEGYCAVDRYRLPARPLRTPSRESREDDDVEVFRFRD